MPPPRTHRHNKRRGGKREGGSENDRAGGTTVEVAGGTVCLHKNAGASNRDGKREGEREGSGASGGASSSPLSSSFSSGSLSLPLSLPPFPPNLAFLILYLHFFLSFVHLFPTRRYATRRRRRTPADRTKKMHPRPYPFTIHNPLKWGTSGVIGYTQEFIFFARI